MAAASMRHLVPGDAESGAGAAVTAVIYMRVLQRDVPRSVLERNREGPGGCMQWQSGACTGACTRACNANAKHSIQRHLGRACR